MALSPSQIQEVLGTVVPVDGEKDVTFIVPTVSTGPGPPSTGGIRDHTKHIYTQITAIRVTFKYLKHPNLVRYKLVMFLKFDMI